MKTNLFAMGLCGVLALGLSGGCDPARRRGGASAQLVQPFAYPDGPQGLDRLWRDILAACQKDDRNRVHDLMASLAMTQDELGELLGGERASALWPRYQLLVGALANLGSVELVAQVYEKKYDDIAVVRVDTLVEKDRQPTDQKVLAAMVRKAPLYTVRVKRKTEDKGLRYDFFVYLGGRWRTGNQLGKFLEGPPAPPVKGG